MALKNGVKNIQAAGYNGARTVLCKLKQGWRLFQLFVAFSKFLNFNNPRSFEGKCLAFTAAKI